MMRPSLDPLPEVELGTEHALATSTRFDPDRARMQVHPSSTSSQEQMARGLLKLLADTQALCSKTQRFRRDVAGPLAQVLRPMLHQQYEELQRAANLIAERMRALGFAVAGPRGHLSAPPPIHEGRVWPANEMIGCLTERHETLARRARLVLRLAEEIQDDAIRDLLVRRSQVHEWTAWMLMSIWIAEVIQ